MPHVNIKLYPGRSEEVKKELADKIAKVVSEVAGTSLGSISVAIEEIEKENWMKDVYDKEIMKNQEILYKKPEY
ncbi:MAG: 4-oxalocrotonate tautomerase family protein [Clostridium sp.]|nr:tautomerase family protein [Clostridium sp.]